MDGSALKTTAEATQANSSRSDLVHPHGKSRRSSKRIKLDKERAGKSTLFDFSDPSALRDILDTVTWSKYGSAAPAIKDLCARKFLCLSVVSSSLRGKNAFQADGSTVDQKRSPDVKKVHSTSLSQPVIILDSDDEEEEIKDNKFQIVPVFDVKPQRPALSYPLPPDLLLKQQEELPLRSVRSRIPKLPVSTARRERKKPVVAEENDKVEKPVVAEENNKGEKPMVAEENDKGEKLVIAEENDKGEKPVVSEEKDKGMYLGLDDDLVDDNARVNNFEDDGLGDIWTQMSVAVEGIKAEPMDEFSNEDAEEDEPDCDHSYILKDDVGYVCRVCGIVEKRIESIIEVQYKKFNRSRSYRYDPRGSRDDRTESLAEKIKVSSLELSLTEEILAHPRHLKQMKPHQVEGFTFLKRNLLDTENPGGCILAHAPGSGKTFMIISFMQSFLAKYPDARPLVVLPKGILSTWKKEFQRWQIENFPLLDFYSSKADGRMQQLEILKKWKDQRSILFLGYNSFSRILTDNTNSDVSASCQEILINLPSIMILDEGHTPRNENTDVLHSLAKVKTPRKVVLSGTLYQNHVKEVFNILKLVRPSFMKFDTSRAIRKRIMSSVQISGVRKQLKAGGGEAAFYELVEYALQQDEDCKRKAVVIRDLREMTSRVLHYYRGDFLDELPGLVDFTVLLKLGPRQQTEIDKLKREEKVKFRRTSIGSAIYIHPILRQMTDTNSASGEKNVLPSDDKVDQMIERFDIREGVKAKFFMAMLGLCEAAGEKLLVFSQFLLPLKFLERLAAYKKGWAIGKEMFMISGDSSPDQRELSMDRFNDSPDARVFFGSIKACGEGISLVGASRIMILDVHLNPSVSRQAVGRAFRPGQVKKVFVYRLVAADSPEEEDHLTCFKKELIAKRWFEWNGHEGSHNFEMDEVDINESGDMFLESPCLAEDVKLLHRR